MPDLADSGFDLTTNYSDYGDLPSNTSGNTVTTNTPDASGDIYSDYGNGDDTSYTVNTDGTITTNEGGTAYSSDLNSFNASDLLKLFSGNSALSGIAKVLGAAGAGKLADKLFGVTGGAGGYKGGIPQLVASRQMLPIPTTMTNAQGQTVPRRPGSGGITYFTPMQYLTPAQAAAAKAGQPVAEPTPPLVSPIATEPKPPGQGETWDYAAGGIANLGSYSDGGRLLKGPGDGVSDSIPAVIGKGQPARLADGEFVIPARIVSELGNGSTEAGARKLYAMMDRIKKARSKAKNIAADTKADKHLPA